MMRERDMKVLSPFLTILVLFMLLTPGKVWAFYPDNSYLEDRQVLDELTRAAFNYIWEEGEPNSGMVYEADFGWEVKPVAVGGTGFGVAAVVAAVDRGWVGRDAAVERLLKICVFLRDKTERQRLHGAFPHWLNGATGEIIAFGKNDDGADIVETSLLMQGLLIARAYFNGPGSEKELRDIITQLWEEVDWNWFTNGEENGLYWHWSPTKGYTGLKILGYNEALITYVLAASSPTHPISRKAYDYWTSGRGYKPKTVFGYKLEASLNGGGPLFLTHYSFVGLDPRRLADKFVPNGYFVRNLTQVLSNRGYCLYEAPAANRYSSNFWGLTASQIKDDYAASDPLNDKGVVAPTAALSSIVYTPFYALEVLHNLKENFGGRAWGRFGPYDAISLRDDWISPHTLAIDQLPIVCMAENFRSGLLWRLFMDDVDVRRGLEKAGITDPQLEEGFPEAVVTLRKDGKKYLPDAYDIVRHPDSGLYEIPFWRAEEGRVTFSFIEPAGGQTVLTMEVEAKKGRNKLTFNQFRRKSSAVLQLIMSAAGDDGESGRTYSLPVRLN